ncbi:hypothetical protein [Alicyclobacillus tolerans]|uniref:Uncharacterized protein n=1 Tax=Alicyclobacillus tolerans TaxID=90970 RepID=A0ABT9LV18_9BACL|nr:hypothetical protein [Alicyclobacillus tengchongensis]MDP9728118.1 hypothetical protein [Alicyclobacillus tengchongensis]
MSKLLFIFSLMLSLLLTGYGQLPHVVAKKGAQWVPFPKTKDIQHVYVVYGLAARSYSPKKQSKTIAQIENWLTKTQPVSIQLPPPPNPPIITNANTNPAKLVLQLSSKQQILISPAYYMSGHSQEPKALYHFVIGVISYQIKNKTLYFKDKDLYNWLKNNQWKDEFSTN